MRVAVEQDRGSGACSRLSALCMRCSWRVGMVLAAGVDLVNDVVIIVDVKGLLTNLAGLIPVVERMVMLFMCCMYGFAIVGMVSYARKQT